MAKYQFTAIVAAYVLTLYVTPYIISLLLR